jgi:hypothetical protein
LGLFADDKSLAAFGPNALDPSCRIAPAQAGRAQGRREAAALAAFLGVMRGMHPHVVSSPCRRGGNCCRDERLEFGYHFVERSRGSSDTTYDDRAFDGSYGHRRQPASTLRVDAICDHRFGQRLVPILEDLRDSWQQVLIVG